MGPVGAHTDWEGMRLPSYRAAAVSPAPEPDFTGITIRVPDRVSLSRTDGRLPLVGVVRFDESLLKDMGIADRHPVRAVVVGLIVAGANAPYVGNAVLQAPLFPAPPGPVVTEYFNVDVFEAIGTLGGPMRCFVFASVGPHLSEVVDVELEP